MVELTQSLVRFGYSGQEAGGIVVAAVVASDRNPNVSRDVVSALMTARTSKRPTSVAEVLGRHGLELPPAVRCYADYGRGDRG